MKKTIIMLAAIIIASSAIYAQDFNAAVGDNTVISTQVIKPLEINKWQGLNSNIPDVIKGQKRTFTATEWQDGWYWVFYAKREVGFDVTFHLDFPDYPIDYVTLDATWIIYEGEYEDGWDITDLQTLKESAIIPNSGNFIWTTGSWAWLALSIKGIDATDPLVTTGVKKIPVTMTGWYSSL